MSASYRDLTCSDSARHYSSRDCSTLRVLIVEDHPLVAAATADLLRSQYPGIGLVVADSAPAAVEQAASEDWLRIFVDLGVPGANGLSLLRMFKELGVVRRCCVVTATRDDRLVAEARRIGVLGYIQKSSTVKNHTLALLRALSATNRAHAVARGLELGLLETAGAACESS